MVHDEPPLTDHDYPKALRQLGTKLVPNSECAGRQPSRGIARASLAARLLSEFSPNFVRIRASIPAICADLADQRIKKCSKGVVSLCFQHNGCRIFDSHDGGLLERSRRSAHRTVEDNTLIRQRFNWHFGKAIPGISCGINIRGVFLCLVSAGR